MTHYWHASKISEMGLGCQEFQTDRRAVPRSCIINEMTRVMQQLHDKVFRVIDRVMQQFPERIGCTYDEHKIIVEALMAGDGERAAQFAYFYCNRFSTLFNHWIYVNRDELCIGKFAWIRR